MTIEEILVGKSRNVEFKEGLLEKMLTQIMPKLTPMALKMVLVI